MSRRVRVTLLCEDTQHEAFARRFLDKMGWSTRQLRVEKSARGHGSAEQFIRERFPLELKELRKRHGNVSLAVLIDGDSHGVNGRLAQLDAACDQEGISRKGASDSVFVFVPTWSIETWLAYLHGETVAQDKRDYPHLPRSRDCQQHVEQLVNMCHNQQLRQPVPASLTAACVEYQRFLVESPT